MCHGSPYHLQRTFKNQGMSPIEYIQKIRLSKAEHLLKHTDMTVMEIALTVGIPNTAHFATLLKREPGVRPQNTEKLKWDREVQYE